MYRYNCIPCYMVYLDHTVMYYCILVTYLWHYIIQFWVIVHIIVCHVCCCCCCDVVDDDDDDDGDDVDNDDDDEQLVYLLHLSFKILKIFDFFKCCKQPFFAFFFFIVVGETLIFQNAKQKRTLIKHMWCLICNCRWPDKWLWVWCWE